MNFVKIVCPKCSAEAKLSLVDTTYIGPRRCWKCHEFFTITIQNNRVTSCEPLSKEEYERQQEAKKAAEKAGISYTFSPPLSVSQKSSGGIEFIKKDEPQSSPKPPEKQLGFFEKAPETSRGGIEFSSQKAPENPKTAPLKSVGGIEFTKQPESAIPQASPEKKQELFHPNIPHTAPKQAEPGKPAIFPPDKPRTFVPMEQIPEDNAKPVKSPKAKEKAFRPPIPPAT